MKRLIGVTATALIGAFLFSGCSYKASPGAVVDLSKVDMQSISTMKSGEACVSRFLIFPTGNDMSAQKAAKKAGIKEIKYQEISASNFLLFGSSCIKVYGN